LAVLLDPVVPSQHSIVHLLRAWQAIARAHARREGCPIPALEQLPVAIQKGTVDWVPEPRRAELASLVEALVEVERQGSSREPPTPKQLRAHARFLQQAADHEVRVRSGLHRRRFWLAGLVLLLLVPAVAVVAVTLSGRAAEPWHGRYYHNRKLEGDPWVRRDRAIDFRWRGDSPFEGFRDDHFSVRWDSCLALDQPTTAAFQLASDDGSRMWIDGRMVIDSWDKRGLHPRGAEVELEPGVHHLRVEYVEYTGQAQVTLWASLDGGPPRPMGAERLRHPGSSFDERDPCRAVRGGR